MRLTLAFALALAVVAATSAPTRADAPSADSIFSSAKTAWRARVDMPFVRFNLRERYEWRGRTHDNWWQVAYRDRDRAIVLHRTIVAEDEAKRLRGSAIGINLRLRTGKVKANSLETNGDADAFPILDPQIEPNASFGLLKREPKIALVGVSVKPATGAPQAVPSASPSPVASATPTPAAFAIEKPLREVGRIEATSRDYAIALEGTERVRGSDTYHLSLRPLRDPHVYRLRELWVDTSDYATVQVAVQGLFDGKPYADARWTIGYTRIDGRTYVQQIRADDPLRFGLDRVVDGLEFDFVAYEFPATLPAMSFERML